MMLGGLLEFHAWVGTKAVVAGAEPDVDDGTGAGAEDTGHWGMGRASCSATMRLVSASSVARCQDTMTKVAAATAMAMSFVVGVPKPGPYLSFSLFIIFFVDNQTRRRSSEQ